MRLLVILGASDGIAEAYILVPKQGAAFLNFEGANQVVELYVNDVFVGKHIGGYTQFNFDITPYIEAGESNLLAVKVNNGERKINCVKLAFL